MIFAYFRRMLDISGRNIMLRIIDDSIFSEYEQSELEDPSPRKELEDRTIYYSHDFPTPKSVGAPVLCDFGSAVLGDKENTSYIQPRNYCSPESMLTVPWSYSVDIWNLGCVVSISTGQYPIDWLLTCYRCGTCTKAPTNVVLCSPATMTSSRVTEFEHILPRSSLSLARRRPVSSRAGKTVTGGSTRKVSP